MLGRTREAFMRMIFAALLLTCGMAHAEDVGALLQQKAQALQDAIAPGKAQVWAGILDDQMVMSDEAGAVTDQAASVAQIKPLPPGASGHIKVIDWKAKVDGVVATASFIADEYENYHGQHLHAQYRTTTSWVKRGADWKLLSMAVLAMRQDPPAVTLSARLTDQYVGRYSGGPDLDDTITKKDGKLLLTRAGRPPVELKAELADVLFVPGQPRSRDIFQRDAKGRIIGYVSRREERDLVFKRIG
jgi:hypothetical protein